MLIVNLLMKMKSTGYKKYSVLSIVGNPRPKQFNIFTLTSFKNKAALKVKNRARKTNKQKKQGT